MTGSFSLALPSPSPATDEDAIVVLLRRHTEEVLALAIKELPTAPSVVRALGNLESYCAAMRGVLADIEEPTRPRRYGKGAKYVGDSDGDFGGFPMGPPGLGGPLAALEPLFDKLVAVQQANAQPHPLSNVVRLSDSLAALEKVEGVEEIRGRLRRQLDEATRRATPGDGQVVEMGCLPKAPLAPSAVSMATAPTVPPMDDVEDLR